MAEPVISVVIEFYNEDTNALAPCAETLEGLYAQDFPLEKVELVLIGNAELVNQVQGQDARLRRFESVRAIAADGPDAHYWSLKNEAVRRARGRYVTFADSDVVPGRKWLSSIAKGLESGADFVVGPSQFRTAARDADSAWMLASALPTWGFVLAPTRWGTRPRPNSLLSHNVAIRREILLARPFPASRQSFNSSLLFFELARAGYRGIYQPEQRVAHAMNLRWWLRVHFRRGWETYRGRAEDRDWPRIPLFHRVKWLEPIALRMALVCRDARHWFRFSKALTVGRGRALAMFPLVLAVSFTARSLEMAGMYAALAAPGATEHLARF